ncbi:DnaJ family domain-containing protein [Paenibacillus mendelii]|uniref:DnaJ family domain-containing protein n=1 Tax=Paenibacillus mendelii TaxID=206163 RepID=A0ABV6J626_9BACL|nr:DnaJ family domain-containing protein [Paenibacillus mendelii]MCQ6560010.1 DUF1992 domain-containing protein [Paenibacillus mendelii]
MFLWFKKNGNKHQQVNPDPQDNQTVTAKPDPMGITEEDIEHELAVSPVQFWNSGSSAQDWIGEMYNEQLKKGAFDHLPGKGEAIEISSGDVMSGILKHANVLPDWLTLQHEIRDQIHLLIRSNPKDEHTCIQELQAINKKIRSYNHKVPSTILQKRQITRDNMEQQLQLWL